MNSKEDTAKIANRSSREEFPLQEIQTSARDKLHHNLYNAMSPIYAQGLTAVFIWQMAPINKNLWQDIPGTNQASYQPPVLYNSTRYRRGVKVSAYPDIAYSNEIQCLVSTVLSSGIIAKDQTIDLVNHAI